MAEGSEKREMSVYVDSATRPPPLDVHGAGTTHAVLEQLEPDGVANFEFIE